jgi:hypothetical protein
VTRRAGASEVASSRLMVREVASSRRTVLGVGPSRLMVRGVEAVAVSRPCVVVSRVLRVARATSAALVGGILGATVVGMAVAVRRRGVSHDVVRLRTTTADGWLRGWPERLA